MDVKPEPTHRQRQAAQTRRLIAAAARELFVERGYVATTIAAISERADIPVQTVYSALGSKARILQEVTRLAIGPLAVTETWLQVAAGTPEEGLRITAGLQRRQYEQMYDVVMTHLEGARVDPDIARITADILANRERGFGAFLESIATHLRPGMDAQRALDVYLTLVLPEVYRCLVLERGWRPAQYESWLGDQLVHELLGR
ncbi:MAG: TetR/AcrR family transcriptional regulator [Kineosporiaceae bacterium]